MNDMRWNNIGKAKYLYYLTFFIFVLYGMKAPIELIQNAQDHVLFVLEQLFNVYLIGMAFKVFSFK